MVPPNLHWSAAWTARFAAAGSGSLRSRMSLDRLVNACLQAMREEVRESPKLIRGERLREDSNPAAVEEETHDDVGDFDVPDLAPEPPATILVCECPCGDQTEITENAKESTTKICGSPRCINCFPGLKLLGDEKRALAWYNAHRQLKDLGFTVAPWAKLSADTLLARFKGKQS